MGGTWFTTEEEITNYIFKQKIRHKKWIVKYFLYLKKFNKSFLYAFICLAIFSVGLYFYNKENYSQVQTEVAHTKSSGINQSDIKDTLQF